MVPSKEHAKVLHRRNNVLPGPGWLHHSDCSRVEKKVSYLFYLFKSLICHLYYKHRRIIRVCLIPVTITCSPLRRLPYARLRRASTRRERAKPLRIRHALGISDREHEKRLEDGRLTPIFSVWKCPHTKI